MSISRRAIYQPELRAATKAKSKVRYVNHTLLVWISVILMVTVLLAIISRGKRVRVDHIVVSGNETVATELVESVTRTFLAGTYLGLFPRDNIALVDTSAIRDELLVRYPRFSDVAVTRDGFTGIAIAINERSRAYTLCEGSAFELPCYAIDRQGYTYAPSALFTGNILFAFADTRTGTTSRPRIGETLMSAVEIERITAFARGAAEVFAAHDLKINVVGVRIVGESRYELVFDHDGVTSSIMFGGDGVPELLHNLGVAIAGDQFLETFKAGERQLLYIDLRFGNKVFFKFSE